MMLTISAAIPGALVVLLDTVEAFVDDKTAHN